MCTRIMHANRDRGAPVVQQQLLPPFGAPRRPPAARPASCRLSRAPCHPSRGRASVQSCNEPQRRRTHTIRPARRRSAPQAPPPERERPRARAPAATPLRTFPPRSIIRSVRRRRRGSKIFLQGTLIFYVCFFLLSIPGLNLYFYFLVPYEFSKFNPTKIFYFSTRVVAKKPLGQS